LLTLYPNPFNQDITIEIHDQPGTTDRAEILDSRGEIITAKPVISKITHFQTKTFPQEFTLSGWSITLPVIISKQ